LLKNVLLLIESMRSAHKKSRVIPAFFVAQIERVINARRGSRDFCLLPWGKSQLLPSFFGQGVTIFVLEHAIEVKVGNSLTNACLSHAEVRVGLDSFPKVTLQNG
jgi:hypothetical protein